jgi:hypothetical protein
MPCQRVLVYLLKYLSSHTSTLEGMDACARTFHKGSSSWRTPPRVHASAKISSRLNLKLILLLLQSLLWAPSSRNIPPLRSQPIPHSVLALGLAHASMPTKRVDRMSCDAADADAQTHRQRTTGFWLPLQACDARLKLVL